LNVDKSNIRKIPQLKQLRFNLERDDMSMFVNQLANRIKKGTNQYHPLIPVWRKYANEY